MQNCYIYILDIFGILTQVMESQTLVALNSYSVIQPRDRDYSNDYSLIAERSTSYLFELYDYLHCVLPNKCFGTIRMVHFYGDYHHSLLKVTHR